MLYCNQFILLLDTGEEKLVASFLQERHLPSVDNIETDVPHTDTNQTIFWIPKDQILQLSYFPIQRNIHERSTEYIHILPQKKKKKNRMCLRRIIGQDMLDWVENVFEMKLMDRVLLLMDMKVASRGGDINSSALLENASHQVRADKEAVLMAVKKDGYDFRYASSKLRADKEVALVALQNNTQNFYFTPTNKLRGHYCNEVVFVAFDINRCLLNYASADLQADRDVVLAAVRNSGTSLEFASKELRGDKEMVLQAVQNDGLALRYASKELQGDKEVVYLAVTNHSMAIAFASKKLQDTKEIGLATMKQDRMHTHKMNLSPHAFHYLSTNLQQDSCIVFYRDYVSKGIPHMPLQSNDIPQALWANILAQKSNEPFYLFYYLTNKPDLVQDC